MLHGAELERAGRLISLRLLDDGSSTQFDRLLDALAELSSSLFRAPSGVATAVPA
jgi:hypothetical protein